VVNSAANWMALISFNVGKARSNAITTGAWQVSCQCSNKGASVFAKSLILLCPTTADNFLRSSFIDLYLVACGLFPDVELSLTRLTGWWAHRHDGRRREDHLLALPQTFIGSEDPDALKKTRPHGILTPPERPLSHFRLNQCNT